jgi:glycosyltransferase involved in cell wall biosynthesis
MYRGNSVSMVIPCHNEQDGIRRVLQKMPSFMDEVIVVDNASTDATADVARELGAVVVEESRLGYGRAYKAGLRAATGDLVGTMDGDATYPPEVVPVLLDYLLDLELDFISARRVPVDWRASPDFAARYVGTKVYTAAVLVLYGKLLWDSQSGMWVFRRSILDGILPRSSGMAFSQEIKLRALHRAGVSFKEIPIPFDYGRRLGASKLSLWGDGFGNLGSLVALRFRRIGG